MTSHPLGKINVVSYLPDIFKPMPEFLFSLRRTTLIVARNVCLIWLQMEQSALRLLRLEPMVCSTKAKVKFFFSRNFLLIKGSFSLNADSSVCCMARTQSYELGDEVRS